MKKKVLGLSVIVMLCAALIPSVFSEEIICSFTGFDPNFGSGVSFTSPYPSNESWQPVNDGELHIHVSNELGEIMNVSFYTVAGTLIGYNNSVGNDSTVNITHIYSPYTNYHTYEWYVTINSTHYNNQSGMFWFKGEAVDADIDRDTYVNNTDLSLLLSNYLQSPSDRTDINSDGIVNYLDRSKLQHNIGGPYDEAPTG